MRGYRPPGSYKSKDPIKRARQLLNLAKRNTQRNIIKSKKSPEKIGREWTSNFYTTRPIAFIEEHCYIPDAIGVNGKVGPGLVKLAKWQKKVIRDLLQKDPKTGLRRYNMGLISTPKKNGKTSTAVFIITWFLAHDEPMGEIILASNSKEQSSWVIFNKLTKNILLHPSMSRKLKMRDDSIENKLTGTVIRTAAPNYKTISGANPSLTVYDELWAYDTAAHRAFFDELTLVPTRKQPMILIVSYAGMDTQSLLYDLFVKGKENSDPKMYFFWTELNVSPWVSREYLRDQRRRLKPNVYARLHCNEWVSFQESFIDLFDWDACISEAHGPMPPSKSTPIVVGVDLGVSKATSAVVALTRIRYGNGGNKIAQARHRIWTPKFGRKLKLELVEDYIKKLAKDYTVKAVVFDPWQMISISQNLQKLYINMVEYPQVPNNLIAMSTKLYEVIQNRGIVLYKDKEMRSHAEFCLARTTERGVSISKSKSGRPIDAVIALALALTEIDRIYSVSSSHPGIRVGASLSGRYNEFFPNNRGQNIPQPVGSRYEDPNLPRRLSKFDRPSRDRPVKIDYDE